MGRIDEAMRRAGGASATVEEAAQPAVPVELPTEAFPAEPGQRPEPSERPVRHARPAMDAPVVDDEPEPALPPLEGRITPALERKVVIDRELDPVSREQYRRLAMALHAAQGTGGVKVIAVSSALANEGKSLTASNLAMTLSESYQKRVLLIDGDLRRPSLQQIFGLPGEGGLTAAFAPRSDHRIRLHRITPHLTVLTAGRPTTDPMAVLASERMRDLLADVREDYDWVVIDTPPIGLLADANLLADVSDGMVLVVKAGTTPYDVVQKAVELLGRDRILGVVLNQAEPDSLADRYQSYYYSPARS